MSRYLAAWLIALSMLGCCAPASAGIRPSPAPVDSIYAAAFPETVVAAGRDLISSRAGEEFTERYIRFDSELSDVWRNGFGDVRYTLTYTILVPELEIDASTIRFTLDRQGELVTWLPLDGIPDCLSVPESCCPAISRTQALAIATKDPLSRSWGDWSVEFLWRKDHGFVWETVQRTPTHPGGLGSRYIMYWIIDARSGEVLDSRWCIMPVNRC